MNLRGLNPARWAGPGAGSARLHCAGLTLLELVVTVGIVGILAAMLLPAVERARRPAVVLACPIAYAARDGTVYLTDPNGSRHVRVCPLKAMNARMTWSPDGRHVSYQSFQGVVVVNPSSQRYSVFTNMSNTHWWINPSTIEGMCWHADGNYHDLWRLDIDRREMTFQRDLRREQLPYGQIQAKYEPFLGNGYLVCEPDWTWTPTSDVVVRNSDWQLARVIWQDPGNNTQDWGARVDSVGERVAWVRGKFSGAYVDEWCVAWKWLDDGPEVRPAKLLVPPYQSVAFCDWTAHDDLLVILKNQGELQLATMNIHGKILQILPTPYGLLSAGGGPAWRRFEHW
ncbi:MAG: hypothetical protein JXQ71_05815 [Verrucomicrobia bacterium]|nr:hypothetical protein [Verrucomicrobiota bacterium]